MQSSDQYSSENAASQDNIFLVGLMGAGKTSVGRLLAQRLDMKFFDADAEIERITGVKIPVIFEIEGESGFRSREEKMIEQLNAMNGIVLATCGGAVISDTNRRFLKSRGRVIYLRAAPEDLWRRTRRDRNRPLLQTADPLGKLRSLHEQRDPLYREVAHLIVDNGSQSVAHLTSRIQQHLTDADAPASQTHP